MKEITIIHKDTNEIEIIFGYTFDDAFRRRKDLVQKDWNILRVD